LVHPITILGFKILKTPKDVNLQSYSIPITVAPGATRIINLPTEFNVFGISVAIQNTSAVANATAILNGDRINVFNVVNGNPVSLGEQWIVQLEITADAGGEVILLFQVVPKIDVNG